MSISFRPLTPISATELFDGRLESFDVHEHTNEETTEEKRMLTEGHNYLWVYVSDGLVSGFTRYFPNGYAGNILDAIREAFDVDIVSEYEPQYWGFDTQEEWDAADAAWAALAAEENEKRHMELLKFLKGEPHDIRPGTIGMLHAVIAKKLVKEDPALLLSMNKSKLRGAIEAIYVRDHTDLPF